MLPNNDELKNMSFQEGKSFFFSGTDRKASPACAGHGRDTDGEAQPCQTCGKGESGAGKTEKRGHGFSPPRQRDCSQTGWLTLHCTYPEP